MILHSSQHLYLSMCVVTSKRLLAGWFINNKDIFLTKLETSKPRFKICIVVYRNSFLWREGQFVITIMCKAMKLWKSWYLYKDHNTAHKGEMICLNHFLATLHLQIVMGNNYTLERKKIQTIAASLLSHSHLPISISPQKGHILIKSCHQVLP